MASDSRPRIAIPMPHSGDREYSERSIPQYERAVELAGGEPVRIPLDQTPDAVEKILQACDGVLLPGSSADVDPAKFGAPRSSHTAAADLPRAAMDTLLLQDAYKNRKPILGICYGLQSLNVYRCGSLIQHVPDFLPQDLRTRVDHEAGKKVPIAHSVEVRPDSKLAAILSSSGRSSDGSPRLLSADLRPERNAEYQPLSRSNAPHPGNVPSGSDRRLVLPVNSSHHQSAGTIGAGLRISARCLEDEIVEAIEGTDPDHFVLAVQWHPERSFDSDEPSRAIFNALIQESSQRPSDL